MLEQDRFAAEVQATLRESLQVREHFNLVQRETRRAIAEARKRLEQAKQSLRTGKDR